MPTADAVVSTTPLNIGTTFGLAVGDTRTIQNRGIEYILLADGTVEPDPSTDPPALLMAPGEILEVEIDEVESSFAWVQNGTSRLTVVEDD